MTPRPIADLAAEALRDVPENGTRAEKVAVLGYALPKVGPVAAADGSPTESATVVFRVDGEGVMTDVTDAEPVRLSGIHDQV